MKVALLSEHHRYDASLRVGTHHFARCLAERGYRIVWLSHPRSQLHRLLGPLPPVRREHADGTVELTLRSPLPYAGPPPFGSLAWGRRWLSVGGANRRRLIDEVGEGVDLAWVSDFTTLPLLDMVRADRVVFRYFDRVEHFDRMPSSIYRLIADHRHHADLEIASSRPLCDSLAARGISAHYVPNGVDVERFPLAAALGEERRREVIYVGAIREWFDLEAVERFAAALPDVLFRLVGPRPRGMSSRRPNVVFDGVVEPESVPELLSSARVGLIPFRLTPLTRGVHPIKLYEYLAAGLPVVASALPEVEPCPQGIAVYRDVEAGIAALRGWLGRDVDRGALHRIAADNTWQSRLDRVFELAAGGAAGLL